ncbi:MAG: hypothetical protein LBO72_10825, partial [Helicobacteraceae bacterium]|nr:hypothetical protein [Helicobacteraceae bacterium]
AAGGKLGLGGAIGSGAFVSAFTKAASLEGNKIVAIAAGEYHSFAIDENGKLYAAGENRYGELGFGDKKHRAEFTQVSDLNGKKILVIAAGRNHSLVLDANGRAYASGYNEYGQLGLGDNADRAAFAEIAFLRDKQIARVAAGAYHLLALGADGKVYGTGRNWHGELGLNDIESRNSFALVTSLEGKKIVAIAAGDFHSFALDSDGKLYAAGMNNRGKLGLGAPGERKAFTPVSSLSEKKIVAIAAGDNHSLAIGADGKVYAAGANRYGQLGLDDKEDRWTFTEVTSFEGKKIIAIAAGRNHSLALDANGRAYASGYNEYGQLGLGDKKNRDVFTPVPLGNR